MNFNQKPKKKDKDALGKSEVKVSTVAELRRLDERIEAQEIYVPSLKRARGGWIATVIERNKI